MKTFYVLILSLSLSLLGKAQAPCSSLCITNIDILQAEGIYTMMLTVQYNNEEEDTHLNYPYVSAVVVGNDTVAEGWMDFFAQLNNTEQQYSANTELTNLPDNFECVVHFRYDKTGCELAYPCAMASISNTTAKASIVCYPNPASGYIMIDKGNTAVTSVELLDAIGKSIARYTLPKAQVQIETAHLPRGKYFLQFIDSKGNTVQTERVTLQ